MAVLNSFIYPFQMETGDFEENNNESINTIDYIKNKYYEKPPVNELFNFKKPTDFSYETITTKTREGFEKFGIYYGAFALLMCIIFILTSPMFIIPFSTVCFTIYLINSKTKINGQEITKQQALIGCTVINTLLLIIFRSYFISRLAYFLAVSMLVFVSCSVHSMCCVESDNSK